MTAPPPPASVRLEDWPQRLNAVLRAARTRVFDWGDHDCGMHAADGAAAVTGVDPGADLRGRYSDYMGGMRRLQALTGARTLKGWADSLFPRTPPALAARGDWALVRLPSVPGGRPHPALAICDGERLSCPTGVRRPMSDALICWRVG